MKLKEAKKLAPGTPIVWKAIENHDTMTTVPTQGIFETLGKNPRYAVFTFKVNYVSGLYTGTKHVSEIELPTTGMKVAPRVGAELVEVP